jgi:hypothetical protein
MGGARGHLDGHGRAAPVRLLLVRERVVGIAVLTLDRQRWAGGIGSGSGGILPSACRTMTSSSRARCIGLRRTPQMI